MHSKKASDITNLKQEIDELDERIIKELKVNSRRSSREIARILKSHPATVSNRIKKLVNLGIIKNFSVQLDYEKLGYEYIGIIEITVKHGALLEVQKKIAMNSNVIAVFDVTGQSDSIVIAIAKNRREFSVLVKSILGMKEVERTNTHVCLNVVKMNL
ncbi:MAG: Lrp/AsnC family transcriptional regulator [Candidatus Micrarchaeota archaeon]|nr:Lrp/AsnC family transcriptional regulator [Candidatus Micrarchaeota archaeon]